MIGNERLEDESNASPTLTEAISRSIRGINGSRMEYGVRILYIDTYGLFLFSFSMNFTEGGRWIIHHGSAGKVSGERWRLLIIGCSCLQTRFFFFLRGWKRSRRAFRVSRDESISRQQPGLSGPEGNAIYVSTVFRARCSPCVVTSGMLLDSSIEFGESWSERNSEILPYQGIIILRLSRENARVGEIISSGVGSR